MEREFIFLCKGSNIQLMGTWNGDKPREEVVPRLWEDVFCYENFDGKYAIGVWSDSEEKAFVRVREAYREILRRKVKEINGYICELDDAAGGVSGGGDERG